MPLPVDRYRHFHHRRDPVADAVAEGLTRRAWSWGDVERVLAGAVRSSDPVPLRAFADALAHRPLWVDDERLARAARTVQRTSVLGGVVLALYGLPLGYLSASGVKPLVMTGRLVDMAPRRLAETNRFLVEVTRPGGLDVGAEGWRICARVRVVHALVRRRLDRRDDWDAAAWGAPVNQAHMAGTNLLFSLHFIDGLRRLNVRIDADEADAVLHLWRLAGHYVGVDPELHVASEHEARRLWATICEAEPAPDADSRALAKALIEQAVPSVLGHLVPIGVPDSLLVPLLYQLATTLLGDAFADALGYPPRSGARVVPFVLRSLVGGIEVVRGDSRRARRLLEQLGGRLNAALADAALRADGPVRFDEVA